MLSQICLSLLVSTAQAAPAPIPLRAKFLAHPAGHLKMWRSWLNKPVDERFGEAPKEAVEFLALDNQIQGSRERPRAHKLENDLRRDLRKALVDLPPPVKKLIRNKLLAIVLVDDLGGSAITQIVKDDRGVPAYGFIALDVKVLNKKANEWASWKESSPYLSDPNIKIEMTIEDHIFDDRASAFQFILLHEIGHIVAIGNPALIAPSAEPEQAKDFVTKPFLAKAWTSSNGKWISPFDQTSFPQRRAISYYAAKMQQLPISTALAAYRNIERTSFMTPYASTNPHDDFADSFACYVHTQWMRKPWSIKYVNQGKVEFELKPCWDQPRCEERQRLLEKIIEQ